MQEAGAEAETEHEIWQIETQSEKNKKREKKRI